MDSIVRATHPPKLADIIERVRRLSMRARLRSMASPSQYKSQKHFGANALATVAMRNVHPRPIARSPRDLI